MRRSRMGDYFKLAVILIFTALTLQSCQYRNRNLTGRIDLEEIEEQNDTIDFYIKEILLINVEKYKDTWIENAPGMNITISIKNKLNNIIYFQTTGCEPPCFAALLWTNVKQPRMDTITFINPSYPCITLKPNEKIDLEVSRVEPLYVFLDHLNQNNIIDPMLALVKNMKFYYLPAKEPAIKGKDTVVLKNKYKLRTDANTIIRSTSEI